MSLWPKDLFTQAEIDSGLKPVTEDGPASLTFPRKPDRFHGDTAAPL